MATFSQNLEKKDRARQRFMAFVYALLATLFALPASAEIPIPNDPLTTGARLPPNILFILDDSGSMAFEGMPNNEITEWWHQSAINNTVYYDPTKDYQPWIGGDRTPLTGGTSYSAVYGDFNNASGPTIDLASNSSCKRYNRNDDATSGEMSWWSGTEVCGGVQTFYVPINSNGNLQSQFNFIRYQIRTDGRVIKSQWLPRTGNSPNYNNGPELNAGCSDTNDRHAWRGCTAETPEYAPGQRRTAAQERTNYATWFSYHRTRMKAAKAGASLAFDNLDDNVRVGFRTIWGRNGSVTSGNIPTQATPIPVKYNQGLFVNEEVDGTLIDNRSKWYGRLHSAIGYNGTPLRGALRDAGEYYSDDDAGGAYGPEAGTDQLACRQNFSILTTDGYWNSNWSSSDGGTINVGNADGDQGVPYADTYSNTLADVAMHYWKNDLRDDLDNIVPISTRTNNLANWQHMVTFGLSIGMSGTGDVDPAGPYPGQPGAIAAWPDPNMGNTSGSAAVPARIDDLLHATVNSRGSFFAASDPDEFAAGLAAALAAIVEQTGSFSNVSANSTSLDTGTRVFQASYVSGAWTGELKSLAVDGGGTTDFSCSDAVGPTLPNWCASHGIPAPAQRNVFTRAGALQFDNLTSGQQESLLAGAAEVVSGGEAGEHIVSYLLGDTSRELRRTGGTLRNRNHLLGDIVSSSPAYSAETKTLYVGANDGMLHAFDAETGEELFAFVPDGIDWHDLGLLVRPDYGHRYFVDGPVAVSTRAQSGDDKNILVGTLGRGGKGLFALDVTNPGAFNASRVLWQSYESDDENMGMILGAPVIAQARISATETGPVVIVANGLNSTNRKAALLVYNLLNGHLLAEVEVGEDSHSDPNGLTGAVGWDSNADGLVDTVYGGDLLGNVWKFDLSGAPVNWGVANADNAPMFVATNEAGARQPISARLTVGLHPSNFRTWVFFGTGRFLSHSDMTDKSVQSLYGIRDDGESIDRDSLERRSTVLAGTRPDRHGVLRPVRSFEGYQSLPADKSGWYIDLLEPPGGLALGERIVSEVQVVNRVLVAASIIPSNDPCEGGGRGYLNALDAFTGTSLAGGSFFDIDGDGDFSDEVIGDDGLPVGSIDLGVDMPTLPNLLDELAVTGGSTGESEVVRTREARFTGRVSWREEVEE